MPERLYTLAISLLASPWFWGVIGWTLVALDYPYGDILPVYAE